MADWIKDNATTDKGASVWSPLAIKDVPGAKESCRRHSHGESWTQYAWLPGVDKATAAEIVEHDMNWGESQGRPGGVYYRRPSLHQTETGVAGVLVRWSGGWDV